MGKNIAAAVMAGLMATGAVTVVIAVYELITG